jgi:predicted GTPase
MIKKVDGKKDVMFIGSTSCGKTSLINRIFKTNHKIGLGVTTNETYLAK